MTPRWVQPNDRPDWSCPTCGFKPGAHMTSASLLSLIPGVCVHRPADFTKWVISGSIQDPHQSGLELADYFWATPAGGSGWIARIRRRLGDVNREQRPKWWKPRYTEAELQAIDHEKSLAGQISAIKELGGLR